MQEMVEADMSNGLEEVHVRQIIKSVYLGA